MNPVERIFLLPKWGQLLACVVGGLAALSTTAPALAQDAGGVETVVVTAEKRAEDVQKVPMSITAFSGDALENQNISDITQLSQLVPSLTVFQTNNNRNTQVMIRGIGTSGSNPGIEPDVGVFLDGVYMPAAGAIQSNLLNISTVEVLRGPQGTLYGRNTAVGAVNINTRKPTQTVEGMINGSFGDYRSYRVAGYVSGGLTENLAGSITGWLTGTEGYETNLYYNKPINGNRQYGTRLRLLWTPTGDLTVDLIGYGISIKQNCCTADQVNPTGIGGIATAGFLAASITAGHPFINFNGLDHKVDDETVSNDRTNMWGTSAKIDWILPWQDTLTSVTAYDSFDDNISQLAADGLPLNVLDITQPMTRKTVSEELRITSPSDQLLEYVAGVYWYHEDLHYENNAIVGDGANRVFPIGPGVVLNPGDITDANFKQKTDSYAIFGQATAHVTDEFRVTVGARYSSDKKNASIIHVDTTSGSAYQTLIFTKKLFVPLYLPRLNRKDAKLTWLLSAQYDITDQIMAYATASTGYKDGGFNARAGSPGSTYSFDPENSYNYELGLKTRLFDGRLQLNVDIYRMLLKGFQESTLDPKTGSGFTVDNAGDRQIQGVELDAQARPIPGLSLSGALTYSDAKFSDYPAGQCPLYPGPILPTPNVSPAGTCSYTGLRPAYNPKWRWSLTGQYEKPINDDLNWFVGASLAYTGDQYLDFTLDPRSIQKAYTLVGAQLGLDSANGWRIDAWGRNLTDETYYVYEVPQPLGGLVSGGGTSGADGFAGWYGAPRTYGVEVTYRF